MAITRPGIYLQIHIRPQTRLLRQRCNRMGQDIVVMYPRLHKIQSDGLGWGARFEPTIQSLLDLLSEGLGKAIFKVV